jgi:hypothetical protein
VLDAVVERSDVRISFDDGNASDVEVALPRLVEHGLTAEFFLLAGVLGDHGRVDHAGVRALLEAGMAIGSHGWPHRDWRRVDDAQAREELDDAHRVLGELTGRTVSRVAIPFGSYDRYVLRRVADSRRDPCIHLRRRTRRPNAWLQARTKPAAPRRQRLDLPDARPRHIHHPAGPQQRSAGSQALAGMIVSGGGSTDVTGQSQLAAVIVTYNSAEVLGDCLRSLADQGTPLAAAVVADNASRDKTRHIAENFADHSVQVVDLGRNAGFAAGVNARIAALNLTRLDAVLILNPDCQVLPGALPVLASVLRQSGSSTVVPRLVNRDGTLQPSLRRRPTVGGALVESLFPGRLASQLGPLGELITEIVALLQPSHQVRELAT